MKKCPGSMCCLLMLMFLTSCWIDTQTLYPSDAYPDEDVLRQTNIPMVYVQTLKSTKIDEKDVWELASLTIDGKYSGYDDLSISKILIQSRGNTSWYQSKRSYSIKLYTKKEILGMSEDKHWVLIGNMTDKTLLRNYYASYLGNEIFNSVWNPSFKSVHLFINSSYRGVYLLGEKNNIGKNRINIIDITKKGINRGGFIREANEQFDDLFHFTTKKGVPLKLKDPNEVNPDAQKKIKSIIQNAENALYSDDFTDQQNGWRKYFDENSVIDWYIVNELTKNNDAIFHASVFLYYNPTTEKIYLGPNWDFDISCGNINYNDNDNPNGWWVRNSTWIYRMFKDPLFVENLNKRWNSSKSKLHYSINTWIPAQAATLKSAADFNFRRWKVLGDYVWPNASGYEDRKTYQSEIDYLIDWLNARYAFLDSALNGLVKNKP